MKIYGPIKAEIAGFHKRQLSQMPNQMIQAIMEMIQTKRENCSKLIE